MAAKVELGSCKLLRSNANYLHQSLRAHARNVVGVQSCELAWTDGERVWLSPIDFNSNRREAACITAKEACLVGDFGDFVVGVSCSVVNKGSSGYYIAVILKEKIVILFREIGEAVVKLVKEYFTECIPQGCEWHSSRPLLAVLSKSSAVLLCFSEEFECTVIPIQTSQRNLQTCSWSSNGKALAVAVEDSLCVFTWTDLMEPYQFTFDQWRSLELTGKIKCIVPWQTCSFIVATELALDKLCANSEMSGDLFEVKNINPTRLNGQDFCGEIRTEKSGSNLNADVTILTKQADQDITSLLKFKLRKQQFEAPTTLAQVIAICCEEAKPIEICRTSVEGLVSPDLLLFQPMTNTVVVGSHSSSKLHCFSLLLSNLTGKMEFKAKEKILELDANTKPKGMCLIPGHSDNFITLFGKSKESSNMSAFPPSSSAEQYDVILQCFNASVDEDIIRKSLDKFDAPGSDDQCFNQVAVLNEGDASVVFSNSDNSPSLRLPDGSVFKGFCKTVETEKTCLISELDLTDDSELKGNSKESVKEDHSNSLRNIQEFQTAMTATLTQITEKLSQLEKRLNEVDLKHSLYPLPDNAEFVTVVWTDELTGAVEQDNFLLDKGRLKLKTIQHTFSASLVRISIGDVPCIVSSGEGGFIPVRFISGSAVQMSGHSNISKTLNKEMQRSALE